MSAAVTFLRSNAPATDRARQSNGRPSLWRVWAKRLRDRRELASMHPEQLRDAGLDPKAVRAEARKPFWRA